VKELFEHFVSDGKLLQLQSNHVSRRYSHCVFRFTCISTNFCCKYNGL